MKKTDKIDSKNENWWIQRLQIKIFNCYSKIEILRLENKLYFCEYNKSSKAVKKTKLEKNNDKKNKNENEKIK